MPLPQPHMPRSHRARRRSRHAAAATAPAAGRRAVRRPSLLPVAGRLRPGAVSAGVAALVSLVVAARAGALTHIWEFLDFGSGVLSLVSLTSTVLWGLVATDRAVLGSGHRLLAQAAHRGLAVSGLGFLALHIWVKVAEQRTTATGALVPFTDANRPVVIGLGTLAGYLFVSVAVSGAVRSAFATKSRSLWWRALHFGAYPAWGASLVHGLKAGRAASGWVTAAYALCLLGVATVLVLRLKSTLRSVPSPPITPPATIRMPTQRRTSVRRAVVRAPREKQLATRERWM
uniref:Integral membrane protein n=1 Tax=Streptomyces sp. NBC_00049 TaxID=2903617 RepID=A0AAU2JZV9_9ACTN